MKVVHLNTYEALGGAARAANALHRGLVAIGVDSRMVVLERQSDDPAIFEAARRHADRRIDAIASYHWCIANRTDVSNAAFSLTFGGCAAEQVEAVREADVINLHWVPELLDAAAIAALCDLGKPVVWTLHDEWAYTGGCHFTAGCSQWREACVRCPQLQRDPHQLVQFRFQSKAAAYGGARLTVVGPSRWIARRAAESAILRGVRSEVIPYGVDIMGLDQPRADAARTRLGLAADDFALVFIAASTDERRKGLAELLRALALVGSAPASQRGSGRLRLVVLGHYHGAVLPEGAIALGHVRSPQEVAAVLSAGDCSVAPSLEDNLPNTVLESLACGTPCVGFSAGGIPDLLQGVPGCACADVADVDGLSELILDAWRRGRPDAELRAKVFATAESRYALKVQARAYDALYRQLLDEGGLDGR